MEKVAVYGGRFERVADGPTGCALLSAQFGGRLRRMFDAPVDDAMQTQFEALLRRIGDKLG
ncbi:hypothetical protein [Methylocella sp.]